MDSEFEGISLIPVDDQRNDMTLGLIEKADSVKEYFDGNIELFLGQVVGRVLSSIGRDVGSWGISREVSSSELEAVYDYLVSLSLLRTETFLAGNSPSLVKLAVSLYALRGLRIGRFCVLSFLVEVSFNPREISRTEDRQRRL